MTNTVLLICRHSQTYANGTVPEYGERVYCRSCRRQSQVLMRPQNAVYRARCRSCTWARLTYVIDNEYVKRIKRHVQKEHHEVDIYDISGNPRPLFTINVRNVLGLPQLSFDDLLTSNLG